MTVRELIMCLLKTDVNSQVEIEYLDVGNEYCSTDFESEDIIFTGDGKVVIDITEIQDRMWEVK